MAHTCGFCGVGRRRIIAPTVDDRFEEIDPKLRINHRYHHDYQSWKRNSKRSRQFKNLSQNGKPSRLPLITESRRGVAIP